MNCISFRGHSLYWTGLDWTGLSSATRPWLHRPIIYPSTRKWPLICDWNLQQEVIAFFSNELTFLIFEDVLNEEQCKLLLFCCCCCCWKSSRGAVPLCITAAGGFAKCFSACRSTDSSICMNRLGVDSVDSTEGRTVHPCFPGGPKPIKNKHKTNWNSHFGKLWILSYWRRILADNARTVSHNCRRWNLPNTYLVNKNPPNPPYLSLCAIKIALCLWKPTTCVTLKQFPTSTSIFDNSFVAIFFSLTIWFLNLFIDWWEMNCEYVLLNDSKQSPLYSSLSYWTKPRDLL